MKIEELYLIGYWSKDGLEYPKPDWFFDEKYPKDEKRKVVEHLENATIVHGHRGICRCRVCGKITPSFDLSNGKFYFPAGLVHYVEEHNVRLPEKFIKNIGKHVLTALEEKWLIRNFSSLKINKSWWDLQYSIYKPTLE